MLICLQDGMKLLGQGNIGLNLFLLCHPELTLILVLTINVKCFLNLKCVLDRIIGINPERKWNLDEI